MESCSKVTLPEAPGMAGGWMIWFYPGIRSVRRLGTDFTWPGVPLDIMKTGSSRFLISSRYKGAFNETKDGYTRKFF